MLETSMIVQKVRHLFALHLAKPGLIATTSYASARPSTPTLPVRSNLSQSSSNY